MSCGIIASLLTLFTLSLAAPVANSINSAKLTGTPWDIIVVGAGPAGIIVADRMSEAGLQTLLLEEGGPSYGITGGTDKPSWLNNTPLSRVDVPGLYSSIFDPGHPSTLTCNNYVNAFGGCTIGGSSAINAGLFFQPPASDWDKYAPAGWKSADVANATKRLISRQASVSLTSADGMRYLDPHYEAAKQWLVNGADYTETFINANANNKTKVFGRPIFDYNNGQRGGPVTTYLQTSLKRSNFLLQLGVRVQRVARDHGQAFGVVALVNGVSTTIPLSSTGRVILSGGALQSPALLMRSAIGDPGTLTNLSRADQLGGRLPSAWINNTAVGAGLFDNPNTFIELSSPAVTSFPYTWDAPLTAIQRYLPGNGQGRSGAYTFAGETSVFWDTVAHADGSVAGMQGTISSAGYAEFTDTHTITLNIYGTSGLKSSGRVKLSGPYLNPGPDENVYFSGGQNGRDAIDIATFIRRIFNALPASTFTPRNIAATSTIQQIAQYITTGSYYARGQVNHWSSSCRFGTCVDTNAQVKGTNNIHVVDASIIPPLTVNPQMGVMIAAERASELILAL